MLAFTAYPDASDGIHPQPVTGTLLRHTTVRICAAASNASALGSSAVGLGIGAGLHDGPDLGRQ